MEKKEAGSLELMKWADAKGNQRREKRGESDQGMYATQEEIDALRSLAATLVTVFGSFRP